MKRFSLVLLLVLSAPSLTAQEDLIWNVCKKFLCPKNPPPPPRPTPTPKPDWK